MLRQEMSGNPGPLWTWAQLDLTRSSDQEKLGNLSLTRPIVIGKIFWRVGWLPPVRPEMSRKTDQNVPKKLAQSCEGKKFAFR
jgi:hypothetical protein